MSDPDKPAWADHAVLERIAAALERIAPAASGGVDWLAAPAYIWTGDGAQAVAGFNAWPLDTMLGVEAQKVALRNNLYRLAKGAAAHDTLLWGARGMGKSALVRSVVADIQRDAPDAIAVVEVANDAFGSLPDLIAQLTLVRRAFVLFCDDLTFDDNDVTANLVLRSLLDGSVRERAAPIRFVVTSNRRALAKRVEKGDSTAMHSRDERDHFLALADRFGLSLGFHPCDQETYLAIVSRYLEPLRLDFDRVEANTWAIDRGNRSGRIAYQFAVEVAGRAGKAL